MTALRVWVLVLVAGCVPTGGGGGGGGNTVIVGAIDASGPGGSGGSGGAVEDANVPGGDGATPDRDGAAPDRDGAAPNPDVGPRPDAELVCTPACAGKACGPDGCGGACGPGCGDAELCADGVCIDGECPEGTFDCDGTCAALLTDVSHCGSCGTECPQAGNALAECIDAQCYLKCPGVAGPVNVDFGRDPSHCGRCGNACPGAQGGEPRCEEGVCQNPCFARNEAPCDGVCIPVDADPANCGACNRVCPDPDEGGAGVCVRGECRFECDDAAGFRFCAGECVHIETDPLHCGRCDAACPEAEPFCHGGDCTFCENPAEEQCGEVCCPANEHCSAFPRNQGVQCCRSGCAWVQGECSDEGTCGSFGGSLHVCTDGQWRARGSCN